MKINKMFIVIMGLLLMKSLSLAEDIECFANGECTQSLFIGEWPAIDAQDCLEICREQDGCIFFTYYGEGDDVCFGLASCVELDDKNCDECYSGNKSCPDLQCWVPGSCTGNSLSFDIVSNEDDCLEACKEEDLCKWFTFDEFDGACILLTDCFDLGLSKCNTCWSGQVQCGDRRDLTKVLLVAGYTDVTESNIDSVEAYDLSSESLLCDPVANYPLSVGLPVGTVLEGLPTVCGGYDGISGVYTDKCYQYLNTENRWVEMVPGMLVERYAHKSSMVDSATWLISGGDNRFGIAQITTEVWHNGAFQFGPDLPTPLSDHCQVTLNSSYIAVLGGWNGMASVPYFHLLDWKNQKWITMPDMPFITSNDPCALIENAANGNEFVVLPRFDECYIFNFQDMTWRPGPIIEYDIPITVKEMTVQMEKNFYVMGGYTEDDTTTDVIFEFDNDNYIWNLDSSRLESPRRNAVAIAVADDVVNCN